MKLRSFSARPKATRIFTDREEPRESFWNTYDYLNDLIKKDPQNWEVTVLSYYGIGGVGKTKLLQKILQEITEKNHKAVYFDFSTEKDHILILEAIKNQLHKKYKFSFTLFELGHYVYANKVGQIKEMPRRETFLNRYPTLDAFVETMGTIPTVNIGSQFIKALDKGVTCLLNSKTDYKKIIRNLENWEPQDLYEYLTELFYEDMVANLEKAKEPLVILLDTYEEFVGEGSSESQSFKNDLWIRNKLAGVIPKVLWVIAGRNKLNWGEEWTAVDDNGWKSLNEHIIDGLSEYDATSFLEHTGITDEGLRHELYGLTEGLPVYLDLCVDRYFEIKDEGKKPEIGQFGKNIETLIARFVKNLDHNTKELVNILSCLRIWNDEMVQEIVPQVYKGFTLSLYEKIKDYSFIVLSDETTFNMHQTVGDILLKKCPDSIKKATETSVVEFMEKKFNAIDAFSGEYVFYTRWLMQYALRTFQDDEKLLEFFTSFIEGCLNELSRCGQFKAAIEIFEHIDERFNASESKRFIAIIGNSFSQFLKNAGEYQDAFEICLDAVDLAEEIVINDGDEEFVYNLMDIRRNYGYLLLAIGRFDDAQKVFSDLLSFLKDDLGEDHEITLQAIDDYGIALSDSGKYQEALKLQEKLLEKRKRFFGEDDLETLRVMNNMANSLFYLGRDKEALSIQKQVLAKQKDRFGEDDPDTINCMNNVAGTLSNLGNNEEALSLQKTVLAKRKEILGEEHPDTISAMNNLAGTLSDLGKNEEAFKLKEAVLAMRKEVLGEEHPDTISAMESLADTLSDWGRNEEALTLKETTLAKRRKITGEGHPDTIIAINNVAWEYFLNKKYQQGLPYAKEAVKLTDENSNIPETDSLIYYI